MSNILDKYIKTNIMPNVFIAKPNCKVGTESHGSFEKDSRVANRKNIISSMQSGYLKKGTRFFLNEIKGSMKHISHTNKPLDLNELESIIHLLRKEK